MLVRTELGLPLTSAPAWTRCQSAGFVDVETLDRNVWFNEFCRNLVQRIRGPEYAIYVEVLGEDGARDGIAAAGEGVVITSQGQLRPAHLRGRKAV